MIGKFVQRIIDLIRGKKKRSSPWGEGVDPARAGANAARAIELIRGKTHPTFADQRGRSQMRTPGTGRVGGVWVIDGNVGGYYVVMKRTCYTVCNPANPSDYADWVEQHETAHDLEAQLGLPPPWHYAPWAGLFRYWYNVPLAMVGTGGVHVISLPGVDPGDIVEVDLVVDSKDGPMLVGLEMASSTVDGSLVVPDLAAV